MSVPTRALSTVLFATFTLWATTAIGQSGASTQNMTCSQAASLVRSRGAIVLHTSPTTYDRFVSGSGRCPRDQTPAPAWVRTADAAQCFVGFVCKQIDLDNGR